MRAPVPQVMSRIFRGPRRGLHKVMRVFTIRRTPINHQYVFSSSKLRWYSVKYTSSSPSKIDPLFNDIVGPGFHFIEDRSHIFSDQPKAEQLDPAENRDQHGQRGPAWRQSFPKEVAETDVDSVEKTQKREKKSRDRGYAQGSLGECKDAVQGKARQLAQGVFAVPALSLRHVELDRRGGKADPAQQSPQEEGPLANLSAKDTGDTPGHQTEIGRVRVNRYRREPIQDPIKQRRRDPTPPGDGCVVGFNGKDGIGALLVFLK